MLMQNYTYVDPIADPLVLFGVLVGVVIFSVAAMVVYVLRTSRSTHPPVPTSSTPTAAPTPMRPETPFVNAPRPAITVEAPERVVPERVVPARTRCLVPAGDAPSARRLFAN